MTHRGGVIAKNYVLHIDDPLRPGRTYCDRGASKVNRAAEPKQLVEDEGCRTCVRLRAAALESAHQETRIPRLTPARLKWLRRADKRGLIERRGTKGIGYHAWETMMLAMVYDGLVTTYVHGGYELTDAGRRACEKAEHFSMKQSTLSSRQRELLTHLDPLGFLMVGQQSTRTIVTLERRGLIEYASHPTLTIRLWRVTDAGRSAVAGKTERSTSAHGD